MTTLHKAAQMALDALEWCEPAGTVGYGGVAIRSAAITALREALAAPEPEPVGTIYTMESLAPGGEVRCHATLHKTLPAGTKLYAAPPAAPAPETEQDVAAYSYEQIAETMRTLPGYSVQEHVEAMREVMQECSDFMHDFCEASAGGDSDAVRLAGRLRAVLSGRIDLAPAAPAPAAPVPDGWVMVPREPTEDMIQAAADAWGRSENGLHNAFAAALRGGIAAAPPAAPAVPLTDEQLAKIAVEDEFLLYCDQDEFNEIARAIELAHGIGGGNG